MTNKSDTFLSCADVPGVEKVIINLLSCKRETERERERDTEMDREREITDIGYVRQTTENTHGQTFHCCQCFTVVSLNLIKHILCVFA